MGSEEELWSSGACRGSPPPRLARPPAPSARRARQVPLRLDHYAALCLPQPRRAAAPIAAQGTPPTCSSLFPGQLHMHHPFEGPLFPRDRALSSSLPLPACLPACLRQCDTARYARWGAHSACEERRATSGPHTPPRARRRLQLLDDDCVFHSRVPLSCIGTGEDGGSASRGSLVCPITRPQPVQGPLRRVPKQRRMGILSSMHFAMPTWTTCYISACSASSFRDTLDECLPCNHRFGRPALSSDANGLRASQRALAADLYPTPAQAHGDLSLKTSTTTLPRYAVHDHRMSRLLLGSIRRPVFPQARKQCITCPLFPPPTSTSTSPPSSFSYFLSPRRYPEPL